MRVLRMQYASEIDCRRRCAESGPCAGVARSAGSARQDLARKRVQIARAIQLDDSLQVLLAPILQALGSLAEIAIVPLSLARSSSHVLTPVVIP